VINKTQYDGRCDIWSLGITVIEMADGFPPYYKFKPKRAMMMVPIKPPPTVEEPSKWSSDFLDFVAKCLVKDPERRGTAQELISHAFIQKARGPEVLQARIKDVLKNRKKEREDSNSSISSSGSQDSASKLEQSESLQQVNEPETEKQKSLEQSASHFEAIATTIEHPEGNLGTSVVHESVGSIVSMNSFRTRSEKFKNDTAKRISRSSVNDNDEVQLMFDACLSNALATSNSRIERALTN